LLLLPTLGWRLAKQRQNHYTYSYDYNLNGWRGIPRDALYFARGDSIVFPAWYFQMVEGRRPDLAIIGVDGLPMKWVRLLLRHEHPDLQVPFPEAQVPFVGNESIPPMVRFLFYSNPARPKYFSYNKIVDQSVPEVRLVPDGLAYHGILPPANSPVPSIDERRLSFLWSSLRLRNLSNFGQGLDRRTRNNLIKDYAIIRNGLGVYYEDMADAVKAQAALDKKPPSDQELTRLYQNCYRHFIWATQWFPDDNEFNYNVGNALFNLGRIADATQWYAKSAECNPKYADNLYNWGVAEYQLAHFQRAGELFDRVLKLNPDKKEADDAVKYMLFQGMYRRGPAIPK